MNRCLDETWVGLGGWFVGGWTGVFLDACTSHESGSVWFMGGGKVETVRKTIHHQLSYMSVHVFPHVFFLSYLFAAIGSLSGAVLQVSFQALELLLYWPVSSCSKVERQSMAKSSNKSGRMSGEAAGVAGAWGIVQVTEGWGFAIEIVMVGWVSEKEAGGECSSDCICLQFYTPSHISHASIGQDDIDHRLEIAARAFHRKLDFREFLLQSTQMV